MKLYRYVRPKQIADRAPSTPGGTPIRSPDDVAGWIRISGQGLDAENCVIATFVVEEAGELLVADRRSEHVACAGRKQVRSAGEITFRVTGKTIQVVAASNQSTGYCPEPESWPEVSAAIARAGLKPSDGFTLTCIFRLCPRCGINNLVKDAVFECGICGMALPAAYNCQGSGAE